MISIVIALIGDSTVKGYAAPIAGTTIPQGVTFVLNGIQQQQYSNNYSGYEVSLASCLLANNYSPTILVSATNGATAIYGQTTAIPTLLAGVVPDVLFVGFGTNDSKNWTHTSLVVGRVLGPDLSAGPYDISIAATARNEWNPVLPIVIIDPLTRNSVNWTIAQPGNTAYVHHLLVRSSLMKKCAEDPLCTWLEQSKTSTNDKVHPNSAGYEAAGIEMCGVVRSLFP